MATNPTIRPWAEFDTTLPDDGIEEDGDFVQLPGKNVAEALGEVLAGLGCEVEPVEDAGDNGWAFHFKFAGRPLWCQVTAIEKYLMVVRDNALLAGLRGGPHPAFVEVMSKFGPALERDGRFLNVEWFFQDQIHTGVAGARCPVPEAAAS